MKKIMSFLPAIVFLSIGLAALVNYLSNTISFQANIESPFKLVIDETETTLKGTIYGGGTYYVVYTVENRANNKVSGKHELTIYMPCEGNEVTDAKIYKYDNEKEDPFSVGIACSDGKLVLTSDDITEDGEATDTFKYEITFNPAIKPGEYRFELVIRP